MVPELIKKLDGYLPYQVVVPLFAEEFQPNGNEEERILGCSRYPEDFDPEVDDPIDFSCSELQHNFRQLRSDLTKESRLLLRHLDKDLLQKFVDADPSLTCAIAVRLARECSDDDEESHLLNDALMLFNEAAEQGDPRAQWILAERFLKIKNGEAEAFRLLSMASLQRYQPAANRLTAIFKDRETHGHPSTEFKCLNTFAQAGVNEARIKLSHKLYLVGNAAEAFKWILKAAESGDRQAQERVAFFYEIGEGCPKDKIKANYWKNLAAGTWSDGNGDCPNYSEQDILSEIISEKSIANENRCSLQTQETGMVPSRPIEAMDEGFTSFDEAENSNNTIETAISPEPCEEITPDELPEEQALNPKAQEFQGDITCAEANASETETNPIQEKPSETNLNQQANNNNASAGLFTAIGSEITNAVGWVAKSILNKFFHK